MHSDTRLEDSPAHLNLQTRTTSDRRVVLSVLLQALQCHKRVSQKVQPLHQVRAAAAEAEIETTASSVGDEAVRVEDLKTGVAHVYGVRGSPEKVKQPLHHLDQLWL